MMKRKPNSSGTTCSAPKASTTRVRSQSVASRRPTPVSGCGHMGTKKTAAKTVEDADDLYRVRSFTTKTGVVVNRGDSFKRRGPRSDRLSEISEPVPGPQSGKIHPPPSQPSAVSSRSQESDSLPVSEPIPIGTGHIVSHNLDKTDYNICRDSCSSSGSYDHHLPHGHVTANVGGAWRKSGRRSSSGDIACDDNSSSSPVYKVVVLGSQGVGKTTLTKQLLTSEYYSSDCNNAEERDEETVTVQLDEEESVIQFIDTPELDAGKTATSESRFETRLGSRDLGKTNFFGDGFLVVYSVTDRSSFRFAQSCLQELRPAKRHNAVILVANKHDLVRKRLVPETEGIKLATKRHCKFIEVSALLDHRLDELLVGIVRQIRLRQTRINSRSDSITVEDKVPEGEGGGGRITETIGMFFQKIFKKDRTSGGKCEDLMVP